MKSKKTPTEEIFSENELKKLSSAFEKFTEKENEKYNDLKDVDFSDAFKRKMNRVFRERAGIENIPHPEVDNRYERIRSKIALDGVLFVEMISGVRKSK